MMNRLFIYEYINRLRYEDVVNFCNYKNISVSDSELQIIYNYIKNDYKRFFNDPMVVLNEVMNKVGDGLETLKNVDPEILSNILKNLSPYCLINWLIFLEVENLKLYFSIILFVTSLILGSIVLGRYNFLSTQSTSFI